MSNKVENIISLINKGFLPPINQDEVFGINTFTVSSSDKNKIKKQAYREILSAINDGLSNCGIIMQDEDCGYIYEDVAKLLRQLEVEIVSHIIWIAVLLIIWIVGDICFVLIEIVILNVHDIGIKSLSVLIITPTNVTF